eukprot:4545761-Prymnesium_polylepis.2
MDASSSMTRPAQRGAPLVGEGDAFFLQMMRTVHPLQQCLMLVRASAGRAQHKLTPSARVAVDDRHRGGEDL